MAAVATTEMVSVVINDVELKVPKGELIVESVKRLGLEIPIFCYHPRMKPVGMCRMCLVEVGFKQPDGSVRMMPKPQAGCTLPAIEGMVVITDSALVHKDRKGVLEFLLINHPLDCPICDRGGECPLQNNTLFYGPSTSRYLESKRHLPKAYPLSRHVTLDLERCIQCGRCVRFTEEISGDANLAFRFRGANMQPSSFQLMDFESKFSGNVIEICPVGALTSTNYRFRARPWDIQTKPGICTVCSNGCNIWFDFRSNTFVRVNGRTNDPVNEEWTCDRGKFGHEFYNEAKRLTQPLKREGDRFVPCSWADAYELILENFKTGGNTVAGLCRPVFSNEGLYLFQKLFRDVFRSNNLDHRWGKSLPTVDERLPAALGVEPIQTPIADLENKKTIVVFGTSPADDLPIVFLRIRKAWFNNDARVVVIHEGATDADSFADAILRYRPGSGEILGQALLREVVASGKGKVPEATWQQIDQWSPEAAADKTGVAADTIRRAAALFDEGTVVVTSGRLYDDPQGLDTVQTLAGLSMITGGEFNCYPLEANSFGAAAVGILPDVGAAGEAIQENRGLGTAGILQSCIEESVTALWLVECDPVQDYHDSGLAARALENVNFLVYQGFAESDAMAYASVVLPMEAPAEQDGSYTNCAGYVQWMDKILDAPGDSKPAWRIFAEALIRASDTKPYFNAREVHRALTAENPAFATAPDEGVHLDLPEGMVPEGRLY
ncbi:MAG: NADH-quinone oxidoreductase subunit G [Fimbriimonadaceae bacterium]|nr:NADH-quinone oxidoreductase subunit G [Fimbriimonadaceae bacterium]